MMILSGHQPTYLPGIILFNKIALSKAFMFVGHLKADPKSFHKRNQIRNPNGGAQYISIDVKHDFGVSIDDMVFAKDNWRRKHLNKIKTAYCRAPFFSNYWGKIKAVIEDEKEYPTLGRLNKALTELLCMLLRIETEIIDGKNYEIGQHDDPNDMLIEMCQAVGADHYLSNKGAHIDLGGYIDENKLAAAGITHLWQDFKAPFYNQNNPEFLTDLSVIDLLFNCGPEASRIVRSAGRVG